MDQFSAFCGSLSGVVEFVLQQKLYNFFKYFLKNVLIWQFSTSNSPKK